MPEAKSRPWAQRRALRDKMRSLGFGYREIAVELARSYKLRPRSAWREALGWTLKEAAERINAYAGRTGLDPDGICPMSGSHLADAESWPGEGERLTGRRPRPYLFALLAAVYGCTVLELIDLADREHLPAGELLILEKYSQNPPIAVNHPPAPSACLPVPSYSLALPAAEVDQRAVLEPLSQAASLAPLHAALAAYTPGGVAYRWMQEPDLWSSWIEHEVLMTAHEGSEHAEQAEQRDIGDATIDQMRADVIRLSHEYMVGGPFALLQDMRRVRGRMYAALDRRLWPRDQAGIYFMLGCVNCLMGAAADDLGYPQAGEELYRAAWAYATAIDHRPLMAKLRLNLATIAYWHGRPRQARDLAESGLQYTAGGPTAAELHLKYGRAAARIGDHDSARRAIAAAHDAREREHTDELLELGGEFGLSWASQHYLAGSTLVEMPGAERDAAAELEHAIRMYAAGPDPGEHHSYHLEMLAHIELAVARLRLEDLDAASAVIQPVLALPAGRRIDPLPQRLGRVRAEIARPRYQGSPQASGLDQQIEEFSQDTIVGALHDLPSSPG
jgi:hypothetical protein